MAASGRLGEAGLRKHPPRVRLRFSVSPVRGTVSVRVSSATNFAAGSPSSRPGWFGRVGAARTEDYSPALHLHLTSALGCSSGICWAASWTAHGCCPLLVPDVDLASFSPGLTPIPGPFSGVVPLATRLPTQGAGNHPEPLPLFPSAPSALPWAQPSRAPSPGRR